MSVKVRVQRDLSINLYSPFRSMHIPFTRWSKRILWLTIGFACIHVSPWLAAWALAVGGVQVIALVIAILTRMHRIRPQAGGGDHPGAGRPVGPKQPPPSRKGAAVLDLPN